MTSVKYFTVIMLNYRSGKDDKIYSYKNHKKSIEQVK